MKLGAKRSGLLVFNVQLDIDMAELATWSPERIKALMDGLAQVIKARDGDGATPPPTKR